MCKAGIVVFNTPGANANAVKEQVLAAMLLASRDLSAVISGLLKIKTMQILQKQPKRQRKLLQDRN